MNQTCQRSDAQWMPSADAAALQLRGRLLAAVREFFASRAVLEVETPIWSARANTDPNMQSLSAGDAPAGFLRTSPEFALKRLLTAHCGAVYELGKVFRAGESGRWHNPEFTMLEWYRPGFDLATLMAEVAALINGALALQQRHLPITQQTFAQLLHRRFGLDPLSATPQQLLDAATAACGAPADLDPDGCLDLLFSCATERLPADQISFVTDFPAHQAALARLDPDNAECALRFEVFIGPVELANGYDELRDPVELGRRMHQENARREATGLAPMPHDTLLLAALEQGLPACCGVSVGIDRLLMCVGDYHHIDQVLAFPGGRA